ncbi:MAG: helix-turn-helix transcriptional regulator [Bacteroidota bacterium]
MKLGAFEEIVLLAIGTLGDDAYGVTIKETLRKKTGNNPSIGALHSALYRLEDKGYVTTREGGATSERGGRRKKYYQLTAFGTKALIEADELRMSFLQEIPGIKLNRG